MLSSTNTINDIKTKLKNDYSYYGYANDAAFVTALTDSVNEVDLMIIIPKISQGFYDTIQAKDKVNLETREEYIYWAEVFYACCNFLQHEDITNEAMGGGGSLSVEGYSRSESESGATSRAKSGLQYWKKATSLMGLAGYNMMKLQRAGGFWNVPNGRNEFS
jgi:hypothetical protein